MTYAKCFVYLVQFLRRLLSLWHVPSLAGFSPIGTQRHHEATEVTTGVTLKVILQRRLKFWKYMYVFCQFMYRQSVIYLLLKKTQTNGI